MDRFTVCVIPLEYIPIYPAHWLDNGQSLQLKAFRSLTCCDASCCYRRKPAEQQCVCWQKGWHVWLLYLKHAVMFFFPLCEDLGHISDASTVGLVSLGAFRKTAPGVLIYRQIYLPGLLFLDQKQKFFLDRNWLMTDIFFGIDKCALALSVSTLAHLEVPLNLWQQAFHYPCPHAVISQRSSVHGH